MVSIKELFDVQQRNPTTHLTGRAISFPLIENYRVFGSPCARVMPGVMFL